MLLHRVIESDNTIHRVMERKSPISKVSRIRVQEIPKPLVHAAKEIWVKFVVDTRTLRCNLYPKYKVPKTKFDTFLERRKMQVHLSSNYCSPLFSLPLSHSLSLFSFSLLLPSFFCLLLLLLPYPPPFSAFRAKKTKTSST